MTEVPQTTEALLKRWLRRLREMQFAQYEAAKSLGHANLWLGVPVVALSTLVGTSVFATLEKQIDTRVRIAIGLVSVTAAIPASLQTFLRFSERAEKHRAMGARAGSIRRHVEQMLASADVSKIPGERLDELRARIDKIAEEAPSVSNKVWQCAQAMMKET